MLFYVLTNLVLSVALVGVIHLIWNYFREKCKTPPCFSTNSEKYKEMIAELEKPVPPPEPDYLSPEEKKQMIEELRELVIL